MKVVRLTRWSEFVERTEALEGWAFRGQHSTQWPLVSTLTRRLQTFSPDPRLWPLREARAMRIFRRKAHIHLQDRSALDDELHLVVAVELRHNFDQRQVLELQPPLLPRKRTLHLHRGDFADRHGGQRAFYGLGDKWHVARTTTAEQDGVNWHASWVFPVVGD